MLRDLSDLYENMLDKTNTVKLIRITKINMEALPLSCKKYENKLGILDEIGFISLNEVIGERKELIMETNAEYEVILVARKKRSDKE